MPAIANKCRTAADETSRPFFITVFVDIEQVGWYVPNILQARSSAGEHYPDTVGVVGSNPIVPTKQIKGLWRKS